MRMAQSLRASMQILQLINRPVPARPATNGNVGMCTIVSDSLDIDIHWVES